MNNIIIDLSNKFYNQYNRLPKEGENFINDNKIINGLYFSDIIYKILFNGYKQELKKDIQTIFHITDEELKYIKIIENHIYNLPKNITNIQMQTFKNNEEVEANNFYLKERHNNKFGSKFMNLEMKIIDGTEEQILNSFKEYFNNDNYKKNFNIDEILNKEPWDNLSNKTSFKCIKLYEVLRDIFIFDLYPNIKSQIEDIIKDIKRFDELKNYKENNKNKFN